MSDTTSEPTTTEPVLERVAKVAYGCTKPETCEICPDNARAILNEVAEALFLEGKNRDRAEDNEAGFHFGYAGGWLKRQAAEEREP